MRGARVWRKLGKEKVIQETAGEPIPTIIFAVGVGDQKAISVGKFRRRHPKAKGVEGEVVKGSVGEEVVALKKAKRDRGEDSEMMDVEVLGKKANVEESEIGLRLAAVVSRQPRQAQ